MVFNGYSASSFLEDVRLHYDGPDIRVLFRPFTMKGVVFSMRDVEFITKYDYENKTRRHKIPVASYVGIIELRITECGKLMFIMGDDSWISDYQIHSGEWISFHYQHDEKRIVVMEGNTKSYTTDLSVASPTFNFITEDQKIFNKKQVDIFAGSVKGIYDFFHGMIASIDVGTQWEYQPYQTFNSINIHLFIRWPYPNDLRINEEIVVNYCAAGEVTNGPNAYDVHKNYNQYFTNNCDPCGPWCNGTCYDNQSVRCNNYPAYHLWDAIFNYCHNTCKSCYVSLD